MCAGYPCIGILIVTASLRQQLGERGRVFAMALVVLQRLFHERELDASELMQQLSALSAIAGAVQQGQDPSHRPYQGDRPLPSPAACL